MDIIQSSMLSTMNEFHLFCEKHNLVYFITAGTLLGAVRHKGFIPWDDDMDIVMPRSDYNKFLKLSKDLPTPYVVKSLKSTKTSRAIWTKLTNEHVIVREGTYNSHTSGVWIDIFPLDFTFETKLLQKIHVSAVKASQILTIAKYNLVDPSALSGAKRVLYPSLNKAARFIPTYFLHFFSTSACVIPGSLLKRRHYWANLCGAYGIKEAMPVEIFEPKKLYSFENKMLWGPNNGKSWLKNVYNDYMKLPNEEERVSPHTITLVSSKIK